MKTFNPNDNMFHVTSVEDLKSSPLTTGSVFHVIARPMFMPTKKCLSIRLILTANEGSGERYTIIIPNNQMESVPVQAELFLMNLDCVATWRWHKVYRQEEYEGEFARSRTMKAVSDSGANGFEVVL